MNRPARAVARVVFSSRDEEVDLHAKKRVECECGRG